MSENSNWKILILEAGGDPSFTSDVPGLLFSTHGTEIDWKFLSEKHEGSCLGMIDEKCAYPRGRVLGGSSSINAMLYVRGNPQDYNDWRDEVGNDDWDYENVLKYFKKSENANGYYLKDEEDVAEGGEAGRREDLKGKIMSTKYHSSGGPLSVSPFASASVEFVKNCIFNAFEELNVPSLVDFNGKSQIGFSNCPGTLYRGTRANAAKMFLNPVKDRPNLFVVKNAIAKKLLIKNGRVEGVEISKHNQTKTLKVKKEVVVSAGAINTPQLLLLSGLGPKDHLESFNIPVVSDLKGVGQNLQDHFVFVGSLFSLFKLRSHTLPPLTPLDAMYFFLTQRPGYLSSIGMTDLTGFVNTDDDNGTIPNIQYLFIYFAKGDNYLLPETMRALRLNDDIREEFTKLAKETGLLIIAPTLLKPKGRGRIELKSNDVNDPPKIHADILKSEEDRKVLLEGIKFLMRLNDTTNFKILEPKLHKFNIAECEPFRETSSDDDYWSCLMKYLTTSLYHPVGTCKMGPETDEYAVVDGKLKVRGVENLRIADASIMPTIVRGNTNAACFMIGEMCSDFIKNDWEKKERRHTEL